MEVLERLGFREIEKLNCILKESEIITCVLQDSGLQLFIETLN